MSVPVKKCAIYTRKSHEKGLEQEFNTLDAQHEACLAYITSQKSEGWIAAKQHYDDGGYSGGSLERPALQQLLEDIKAGKINIVVVYKIDRLTRSLADFAKLVEVFDQHGVSFVSVTQSFNTTTSMGRLTLNVLLSFAQFEREVISERIRDKFAASKKKGMWMGGCPPLGYDVKERRLVINEKEAETIRYIFDGYFRLESVARLQEHLEEIGVTSKSWVSSTGRAHKGQPYGYGALHNLLTNPAYAGYIRHKDAVYEGLHEAIIPREKWQALQDALIKRSRIERGSQKQPVKNILKGKIFDRNGAIYTPMRAYKKARQYRYYVNKTREKNRDPRSLIIARLPAHEIETLVLNTIITELKKPEKLAAILEMAVEKNYKTLEQASGSFERIQNLHCAVHKITVDVDQLMIEVNIRSLLEQIKSSLDIVLNMDDPDNKFYTLSTTYHTHRARKGAVMIQAGDGKDPLDMPKFRLESLVKGIIWRDEHFGGKSFREIARMEKVDESYVRKIIGTSFQFRSI